MLQRFGICVLVWGCCSFVMAMSDELRSLNHIAPPGTSTGALVDDVRDLFKARQAQAPKAGALWVQAASQAQKPLAPLVLQEWGEWLSKTMTADQVVVEMLSRTKQGSLSPFMRSRKLTSIKKLREFLAHKGVFSEHKAVNKIPSPWSEPSLHRAATLWCQNQGEAKSLWSQWQSGLSKEQIRYWGLLQKRCESIEYFETQMRSFVVDPSLSRAMRVVVLRQLAVTQRQLGQRSSVWTTYDQLLKAWTYLKPTLAKDLLKKIDDHLWAARYHSFIGHYDRAHDIILKTEAQIKYAKKKMDTAKRKRKLRDLAAEALHIRSFRIAVGQQKYLEGAQLISQNWAGLPQSWKQRFQWYEGLLYYLSDKPQQALQSWTPLMKVVPRKSKIRPKILFWLSRVSHQLKLYKDSQRYRTMLAEESPFSFYHVVALKEAGFASSPLPVAVSPLRELKGGEKTLSNHSWVGPLWKKSQLLLQAGLLDVAKPHIKECDRRIRKRFGVGRFMTEYVHLSRLHFRAGNFRQAISLNADLSGIRRGFWQTWPDQISVFFPRPFFHRWGQSNVDALSVPTATLLAIARQESAFDSKAVSPANAFGLMQLTLPTARSISNSTLQDHELAQKLLEPDRNIQLGALYVESLKKRYKQWPHVFAAYNAGELAVDTWLKHRAHHDILTWLELIPFGETRSYAMAVWRNQEVYQKHLPQLSLDKRKVKRARRQRARAERPLRERHI
ncbi:MAG: lytic transglycosylase domain-containing protein [Oligoflexales bacterium]